MAGFNEDGLYLAVAAGFGQDLGGESAAVDV
jgi:hypothetical protein